jgi:hypothetical protein
VGLESDVRAFTEVPVDYYDLSDDEQEAVALAIANALIALLPASSRHQARHLALPPQMLGGAPLDP